MRHILLFLLLAVTHLNGVQPTRMYSNVDVEEHRLESGLRVLIKKNQLDEGEVFVRIFSKGGYAQEKNLKDKVSAYVSFLALFESGFGLASSPEQLSKILYDNSAELSLFVLPSCKGIEAKIPSRYFDQLIEFISGAFESSKITREGFTHVIHEISQRTEDQSVKNKYNVLTKMYQVHFDHHHFSSEMPGAAIESADIEYSQKFVDKAFGGDDPFTFVVVGDIDSDQVIASLDKHIPKRQYTDKMFTGNPEMIAANEPRMYMMKGDDNKESVSSIVYSIKMQPDGKELALYETSLRIIENRLDEKLSSMVGRKGFRVSFEFPYYPEVSLSWVQIKFNVHPDLKQSVTTAIHTQLTDLVQNGPSRAEFERVISSLKRDGTHLQNDNYFWLSVLSDYAIWDWDLNQAALRVGSDPSITAEATQGFLKKSLVLEAPVSIFLQ